MYTVPYSDFPKIRKNEISFVMFLEIVLGDSV